MRINGDARPGTEEPERPLSARSFSRTRSTSFSKGLHTGENAIPGADHWHQGSRQPWNPCIWCLHCDLRSTAFEAGVCMLMRARILLLDSTSISLSSLALDKESVAPGLSSF